MGPRTFRAVGRELKLAAGQIDGDQVSSGLCPVLRILGGLVHARGELTLAMVVSVEQLDLADERVVGIQVGATTSPAQMRTGTPSRIWCHRGRPGANSIKGPPIYAMTANQEMVIHPPGGTRLSSGGRGASCMR